VPEVVSLLGAMQRTSWLQAALIYGGGLRVTECCCLRVKDIDFDQGLLFVRKELRNPAREPARHAARSEAAVRRLLRGPKGPCYRFRLGW
jgi:integrase